ncbi:Subunit of the RNA polymerase II-associated Paf1 complex [Komagataella phaffii GS115]|uniref:Subunit of the RNA polymerase II-associated Paf1 complex n=1 Tax=Komagataella phaffii (strain GS115 / ATCC 20864) TaxID=644223 RepID=C4QYY1_KOMPG|nr:Subunit of the RNA polymerase II-associated Paf1 complex [Komagataella phaffii GS115]CAY68455.1 Subunit of the RNA polymerase II-associated Paf1 complex [Komagataella phaffii GS115]
MSDKEQDLDEDLLALAGAGSDSESNSAYSPEQEVSRKSKKIVNDSEDENNDSDGEQLLNPYPLEDKFKDEADRARLLGLSEMEREAILYERSQEVIKLKEKHLLSLRAKQSQLEKTAREGPKSSKTNKLSELKKQREQKSKRQRSDEYSDEEDDYRYEEVGDNDDVEMSDNYIDEDDAVFVEPKKSSRSQELSKPATLSDINKIIFGRTAMSKYWYYPEFDDVVKGMYLRLNTGSGGNGFSPYKVVEVLGSQRIKGSAYGLNSKENNCDMYLKVAFPNQKEMVRPLFVFSDSSITHPEFDLFLRELDAEGLSVMDLRDVDYKKAQLQEELEEARDAHDHERVARIEAELKSIGAESVVASKASSSMLKIDQRNKKLNNRFIRKAEMAAVEKRKLRGTSESDPFYRLATTARMFYKSANLGADDSNQPKTKAELEEEAKQEKKLEMQKLESMVKSNYRNGGLDRIISKIDFDFDLEL